MHKLPLVLLLALGLTIFGCNNEDDDFTISLDDAELITKESDASVDNYFAQLQTDVTSRGLMIVAPVDHAAAAASVGLTLRPTKLLIFGNPEAGTQLMQADQRIGIDLPLKVLVWEDEDGETNASYFNASTLTDRYGIDGMDMLVDNINTTLDALTPGELETDADNARDVRNDMITKVAINDAATTFSNLEGQAISRGFTVIAKVEHDVAAQQAGLTLRPTKLIVFGNPMGGTQLMQQNQKIGIDLPLKILVWEDETGQVNVSYFNGNFLTDRYDIGSQDTVVDNINTAMEAITDAVTQ